MKNQLPDSLVKLLETYKKNSYKAYIVGGAVRNTLLGINVSDYDIVTDALPEESIALFKRTLPTGIKHGTITVFIGSSSFEVTTMRKEGSYSDMRHPDRVEFVKNIEEDLKRRDFTVNAMAYDLEKDEIIDLFGGRDDLKKGLIKTVGDPNLRFSEDALRILRAVRFASQYNFNIEAETLKAMAEKAYLINRVSMERIYQEFKKILESPKPSIGISLMIYTGLFKEIFPELLPMAGFNQFSSYHDKDVLFHSLKVMDMTENDHILRLAALFHDSGKPYSFTRDEEGRGHFYGHEEISAKIADDVLKRLRTDKKTRELVVKIVSKHMVALDIKKEYKIKNLIRYMKKENMDYFFKFKKADFEGKPMEKGVESKFLILKNRVSKIIKDKEPLEIEDLDIKGDDLRALGLQGKKLGLVLNELLEEVLKNKDLNRKSILIDHAVKIREKLESEEGMEK